MQVPFKQRMCSVQNAINYVKVATLELCNELGNEIRPFAREVFMADVTNSITQLTKRHK